MKGIANDMSEEYIPVDDVLEKVEEVLEKKVTSKRRKREIMNQLETELMKPLTEADRIMMKIAQSRKIKISSNPYTSVTKYSFFDNYKSAWRSFDDLADYILFEVGKSKNSFCNIAKDIVREFNAFFNKDGKGLDIVFEGRGYEKAVLLDAVNANFAEDKIRVLDSNRTILSNTEVLNKLKDIHAEVVERFKECESNQAAANQLSNYVEISRSVETITDDSTDIESEVGKAWCCLLNALTAIEVEMTSRGFDCLIDFLKEYLEKRSELFENHDCGMVLEKYVDKYNEKSEEDMNRLKLIESYIREVRNCVEYSQRRGYVRIKRKVWHGKGVHRCR